MGQTWHDTALEGARSLISRDLDAAERRVRELVRDAPTLSGTLLAQSLLIPIVAHRGQLETALCSYLELRQEAYSRQASKVVRAEIELQGSNVYVQVGLCSQATVAASEARRLLHVALETALGSQSPGGKRRLRRLRKLEAASWIMTAQVSLKDDTSRAYREAKRAAELSDDETVQISALELMANAAPWQEAGTLASILPMITEAERRLKRRRRPPLLHLHQLKWNRAIVLAKAGLPEEAEEILLEVVAFFTGEGSGYREEARRVAADLAWVRELLEVELERRGVRRRSTARG